MEVHFMLEIIQLEQLISFAKHGTLSGAADELHLSQPALTRSMQKLEQELNVTIFVRHKNRIGLNETGQLAVEYAKAILKAKEQMVAGLLTFEKRLHSIHIGSCAPAPMWKLTPMISSIYPYLIISSELSSKISAQKLLDHSYQIIITSNPIDNENITCNEFCKEHLYLYLPPEHPLSNRKSVAMEELNGEKLLLPSAIGFWKDLCYRKMPHSHLLFQEDYSTLYELQKASSLPTFASDLGMESQKANSNRIMIPISDAEANVTYFCSYLSEAKKQFSAIFK